MDNSPTESAQATIERGGGRAFLSPDDKALSSLEGMDDDITRENRLALALKNASTERLKSSLAHQVAELNTEGALRVSSELTLRGIAPCFRDIPINDEWLRQHWSGVEPILLLVDLQWIVSAYPDHVPEWKRVESIFNPRKFRKTAEYLHWDGKRSSGQIAKALALTEQQQRECVWIQCLHVERWRRRLLKRLPIAQARIASDIRDRDKRPSADQDETINRRSDLWLCAELADWKPQRTATLYAMKTGKILPRNVVGKQLEKLPKVRRTDEVLSSL